MFFTAANHLLVRKPIFADMCARLRACETDDFKFQIGLQTNATLIDAEWIELFAAFDVAVSVSLDGPEEVNDTHRFDRRRRSSYAATIAGLRQLQTAAQRGRLAQAPGILCVVNPEADGARVYRHFVDDLGVKVMDFLAPAFTHDSKPEAAVVQGVNRFLVAVLKEWLRDDNKEICVRGFLNALTNIGREATDEVARYAARYRNDYRNIICIASDGSIGVEDTLHAQDPEFWSTGLNCRVHDFDDLRRSDAWRELERAATERPEGCRDCGWWRCCKGGRLVHRYARTNGLANSSIYCAGLQDIYALLAAQLVRSGTPVDGVVDRLVDAME